MDNENTDELPTLTLLLLDDEENILYSLKRLLRKDYNIVSFKEGHEAIAYLEENSVDLIMSDMRMPKMDGVEFLIKSRELQPNPIRLLLTGYSDIDSTIKAINDGAVYTYISKPWENEDLKLTLAKAAEHYLLRKERLQLHEQLTNTNQELAQLNQSLEQKVHQRTAALNSSNKKRQEALNVQKELLHDILDMMAATIEYRTGFSTGHINRIAVQSRAVAKQLGLDSIACRRVYLCALLHEIGTVGLTDEVLSSVKLGNEKLDETFSTHPLIGAEIIGKVKRFSSLTGNIKHQNENVDGTGLPDHLSGEHIPVGARIIRVVKDFDFLIAGKQNDKKMPIANAQAWIKDRIGTWYDRAIVNAFLEILAKRDDEDSEIEYSVGIETIKSGDIVLEDLILHNGNLMLKAGQEINTAMINKLKEYEENYNTKVTLFIA